jgi:flagellar biosynthesis/type III secretory pathway protein FliH
MTGFRFETFAPVSDRPERRSSSNRRANAEALPAAAAITEQDLAVAREEAYRRGYLDAQAELTQNFLDDRTRLTSDFVEAINDSRLTNEAARRHVAASLAPMVLSFCDALAPVLTRDGLAAEIVARVERALALAPAARPILRCAPELAPSLEAIFAEREEPAVVRAAPELLPREVELHWDEGYDLIDLDACLAEIRACLASHLGAPAPETPEPGEDLE